MERLVVLYDSACPFCARCRDWLEARDWAVRLSFVCCRSQLAREHFGNIPGLGRDLAVVDEHGRYWIGPAAFVLCFWALEGWRILALLAASFLFWPFTEVLFAIVSDNRDALGRFVGTPCTGEHCGLPPARSPYR
jgi:predicted DCC family thiol-disulfide oxidoreductase YuxK